jgi:hypothetical protein
MPPGRIISASVIPTPVSSPSGTTLFASAFTTATGQSDAAVRDTGRTPHWTSQNGALTTVIPTGTLGFPTVNCSRHPLTGVSSDVRVESVSALWAVPANTGDKLGFRWYFRIDAPDSYGAQDFLSFHPFEPEPGACPFQWENQIHILGDGTFILQLKTPAGDYISNTPLNKGQAYREEVLFTRTATPGVYKMDIRVYDASNTLVLVASNFTKTVTPFGTLQADNPDCTIGDACVRSLNLGTNGPGGSFNSMVNGDTFVYVAGVRVATNWPGPYVQGE